MKTLTVITRAKKCYGMMGNVCSGDAGDIECFFCPGCVLSVSELLENYVTYHKEIYDSRGAK